MQIRSRLALAAVLACASAAVAHDDPLFQGGLQAPFPGPFTFDPSGSAPISFPRSGVSLLSWLPLNEFGNHSSGADCWGYVSPSGREYAIIGCSDGVGFVEVTDPGAPQIVAVMTTVNSLWHDMKVYQDHCYHVSEGGGGITVYSMAQIDNGIVTQVNQVTTGGTSATHNVAIDEVSGFLYRTGGSSHGLRIYSLANKATPAFVGEWNTRYVHDAQVVTYTSGPYAGKQIAFAFSESSSGGGSPGVNILDVTNKSNIISLSLAQYSNPAFSHQGWLTPDRQYLYLNDELDELNFGGNTVTRILNVSNLSNPSQVGTFSSGVGAIDHNLYTLGNQIFEANYRSGLRIFNSSIPTAPVQTAWFDTYPEDDGKSFNGLWNAYPYLPSGTVLGSDLEKGLFVWRVGDPLLSFDLMGSLPTLISSFGQAVQVKITEQAPGMLATSTVRLNYDTGSGFLSVPMASLGGGVYQGVLPTVACGSSVDLYVSARSTDGTTWTLPEAAPTFAYQVTAATQEVIVASYDMETDPGWSTNTSGDNASTGIWTRVNPVGTTAQPEDDHTDSPGNQCYVTGQGTVNGGLGDNDVDGGKTTLTTNSINLSGGDADISYWRWYSNGTGGEPNADVFRIDISNNNGGSWTNVETIGPSGAGTLGGWIYHKFTVSDFVPPTANMRMRFIAEDQAGGSIIEAAIDDFMVARYDCSQTCQQDLGFGGPGAVTLSLCGQPLSSGNQATLAITGAPASAPALLAIAAQNNPTAFLGGLLVPIPLVIVVTLQTNGLGEIQATVSGGGGPATVFVQAIVVDPGQPLGVALSNALQVTVGS